MLTLGVGMFIGAKVAGNIEELYTPAESLHYGYQVEAITSLEKQKSTSPSSDLATLIDDIDKKDEKITEKTNSLNELATLFRKSNIDNEAGDSLKDSLKEIKKTQRLQQLTLIDWQPLWGIPAVFAGAVLVFFMIAFRDNSADQQENTIDTSEDSPDEGDGATSAELETVSPEAESCSTEGDCETSG